jgi:hypothetical protein
MQAGGAAQAGVMYPVVPKYWNEDLRYRFYEQSFKKEAHHLFGM